MNYHDLTVYEVVRVAEGVLHRKGTATHLDFKIVLREEGFWATQYEVAQLMYFALDMSLFRHEWTYNGTYRTYYLFDADALHAYESDDGKEIKQNSESINEISG